MLRRSFLLPALAPALLIGGCMGTQNRGLESVHQPVVARQDYALDLQTAGDGLARGEVSRLYGWLGAMKLSYGDKVTIDDPAWARGARDEVARVVAGYGLLLSDQRPVVGVPVTPGTVRVVVTRMQASVPGCPDWSRDEGHEYDSNTSSNYGCSTNASLAAMIANPEDLLHGQANDATAMAKTIDTARSAKAIDALRNAAPSGGGGTSAGGGK